MVKSKNPFDMLMKAGGWKDSHNLGLFLAGTILFGIAMGMGNSLGGLLMKGLIKDIDYRTNILPPSLKDELYSKKPANT